MPSPRLLPLSAVVGAEGAKTGLLALAASPSLGGMLLRGDKGTAKSTLARGLAALLPPVRVAAGCPFGCAEDDPSAWCEACRSGPSPEAVERPAPFVTLPLGATEDQVVGTIDLERALRDGERHLEPGLLARANGGVLYVDEVNLLDDHLVDLLLDVAASGVNVVAREGLSLSHPARLLLVGTMNPEEGELRPQLLDRFGLCAELGGETHPARRAEIVERVLAFERDPESFESKWSKEQLDAAARIRRAREIVAELRPDRQIVEAAARLSLDLEVDGHRADVLLVKTAMALAALDGREEVLAEDVEAAAPLVYAHRLQRRPFDQDRLGADRIAERAREALAGGSRKKAPGPG